MGVGRDEILGVGVARAERTGRCPKAATVMVGNDPSRVLLEGGARWAGFAHAIGIGFVASAVPGPRLTLARVRRGGRSRPD